MSSIKILTSPTLAHSSLANLTSASLKSMARPTMYHQFSWPALPCRKAYVYHQTISGIADHFPVLQSVCFLRFSIAPLTLLAMPAVIMEVPMVSAFLTSPLMLISLQVSCRLLQTSAAALQVETATIPTTMSKLVLPISEAFWTRTTAMSC